MVEAVPPRRTAMVPLAESVPAPSTARTPLVSEENLTVEVAKRVPRKGEEEALKVCSVPDEVIAKGPLAVKVCVLPVNPPREVMPVPLVAPIQVPLGKQTFPVPLS